MDRPPLRPLLVTFHCGVFFFVYALFVVSIGRRDVEEAFATIHPDYIRNMLALYTLNFIGYLGLWNLRKWGWILLLLGGVPLAVYGHSIADRTHVNFIPYYLPVVAAVTTLPLWPALKWR